MLYVFDLAIKRKMPLHLAFEGDHEGVLSFLLSHIEGLSQNLEEQGQEQEANRKEQAIQAS